MPLYICKCCDYKTKIKPHYSRHLNTNKHKKNNTKSVNIEPKKYHKNTNLNESQNYNFICNYCDKTFSTSSHLSRHKKKKL